MSDAEDSLCLQYFEEDNFSELFESSSDSSISSLSSDSDDDRLYKPRKTFVRIKDFVQVSLAYEDFQFRANYRVRHSTFSYILELLQESNLFQPNTSGRKAIDPKKALLMSLWFLGNTESYRQISERFDVTRSCAFNIIKKVIKFLVDISPKFILWPKNEEASQIIEGFRNRQGIDGIQGAIDGSHIKINRPKYHQEAYCNRKGDHSILLQGVVDHQKRFIDVFCGEAGSIHDARMLKRSSLYERACSGEILVDTFLLGDSAYPSLRWLVPPFKDTGNLTQNQKNFNYRHSSTRMIVENSFALLKGRYRRLKFFENIKVAFVVQCVVAACVLHNICINMDDLEEEYVFNDGDDNVNDKAHFCLEEFNINFDKRQEIFNALYRH